MENQETIILLDENGNEIQARIINIVEIDGQEYLLYSTNANEEEENVYVNKIMKDTNGEEEFVPIENDIERNYIFNTLKEMIDNMD